MNLTRLVLATVLACLLCGCGTFNNSIMMFYHQPPSDPPADYQPANWVYGGVKSDAKGICLGVSRGDTPLFYRLLTPLWIADIPLSALCDTLNLTYTIPETQSEADWWRGIQAKNQKTQEMMWADYDDAGNQLPQKPPASTSDTTSETN